MGKLYPTVRHEAVHMSRRHGEALLHSAFATLPSTSPRVIGAMTLSVPVDGNDEAVALQELALKLAGEHDMDAEVGVHRNHLIVRLTRRDHERMWPPA